MKTLPIIIAGITLAASTNAFSEEEKRNWSANAELGFVSTSGNTETTNLNAKLAGDITKNKWVYSASAESTFSSSEDETGEEDTTAEKYLVMADAKYSFSDHDFTFLGIKYEKDRFSTNDYQVTLSAGYGRRIIDSDTTKLAAEIGPGYRYTNVNGDVSDQDDEEAAVLHLGMNFSHKFNATTKFGQELSTDIGEDNTESRSVTSLTASLTDKFAMKTSFTVEHASDVPDDTENTDTKTTVTLVYSF